MLNYSSLDGSVLSTFRQSKRSTFVIAGLLILPLAVSACAESSSRSDLVTTLADELTLSAEFGQISGPGPFADNLRRQNTLSTALNSRLASQMPANISAALEWLRNNRFACAEQALRLFRCVYSRAARRPPSGIMTRRSDGSQVHHLVGVTLYLQARDSDDTVEFRVTDVTYALEWMLPDSNW